MKGYGGIWSVFGVYCIDRTKSVNDMCECVVLPHINNLWECKPGLILTEILST